MTSTIKAELELRTSTWPGELPDVANATQPRLNAHQTSWINAVSTGFGHPTYLLQASENGQIVGVLPLCLVAGPIFGRFLVSLPYVNTGGVWAKDVDVAAKLVSAACDLADQLNVKYLEFRHELEVAHPKLNFQRTDKVHMRLPLPATGDALLASLKSKVRSQVKKSMQYGLEFEFGGRERLDDFYHVFSINMRDLGTPVFSKRVFKSILEQFGDDAELCIIRSSHRPAAAGLLVHTDGMTEVPSASCLREFNRVNANMFMYWHLLNRAIERGSDTFDFGRSSKESGTFKFKSQWGAHSRPAVWQYYVREGDPTEMRADSGNKAALVNLWKKLPVWLTRIAGPTIVRGIP